MIVSRTSVRGLVTAGALSVTLNTAAPVSVSTTSETPFLSSLPTASVSAAVRDLQSKSPQSPPAAALSSLENARARPAKSSPPAARFWTEPACSRTAALSAAVKGSQIRLTWTFSGSWNWGVLSL